MTKDTEIQALDAFIAKLGPHSYLGPWLADNRLAIVADIKNDLPVDLMLPGEARKHAATIIHEAREEAARLRIEARVAAENLQAQAQRQCDSQRQIVADLIRRHAEEAARALGRL